jgi:prevent-host-death family protein
MTVVTVHQAKSQLSKLIAEVAAGGEVVIARGKTPVARLTAIDAPKVARTPGRLNGKLSFDDRFFEPLPDDELTLWNGETA